MNRPRLVLFVTPFLIGLLPLLNLFKNNPGEIWFYDFCFLYLILCIFLAVVFGIYFLLSRKLENSSIATSILALPFLLVSESQSINRIRFVWAVAFTLSIIVLLIRLKSPFLAKIQKGFLLSLLVLISLFSFSVFQSKHEIIKTTRMLAKELDSKLIDLQNGQKKIVNEFDQDVYFIILDEYVSPIAFRQYYQYDNEHFFSFLESSGFKISENSYSNYPWTIPSVSSMVTMDYHKNWVKKKEFPQVAHFLLRYNLVGKIFQKHGYDVYSIPSIYWLGNPSQNPVNDFYFRSKSYGMVLSFLRSTIFKNKARQFQRKKHKKHIDYQLSKLSSIINKNGNKKFVFTHFLCPHRPIVFDKEGNDLDNEQVSIAEKDKNHTYYLDQAYFISTSIRKTIKEIINASDGTPLIVIVSDHGKFPIGISGKNKQTLPLDDLSWRLSNFTAIYDPDNKLQFSEVMTPVNIFRTVFKEFYGYQLEPLKDLCNTDFFNYEHKIDASLLLPFQHKNLNQKAYKVPLEEID